jgi:hypothetical protein
MIQVLVVLGYFSWQRANSLLVEVFGAEIFFDMAKITDKPQVRDGDHRVHEMSVLEIFGEKPKHSQPPKLSGGAYRPLPRPVATHEEEHRWLWGKRSNRIWSAG